MSIKRQLMSIAAVLLVAALANTGIVLYRLEVMDSDARVINHAGIVRGASQRLVKRELAGEASDELITTIDKIIAGLQVGSEELDLPAARDQGFSAMMEAVDQSWTSLKQLLIQFRSDNSLKNEIHEASEAFFETTDGSVFAAQSAAQRRVRVTVYTQLGLLLFNLLVVAAVAFVTRRMTLTLNQTVASLAATSAQIAATVDMHERIASDQAAAMNETTTTMEQLGQSSRVSAKQAHTGADETTESLNLAVGGAEAVKQTLNSMADLKTKVAGLAQEIVALSDRVDQISEISAFVGDIANQTNLLAMNAAVEAAHAGQHGKGFAVVATEIRKLADQSSKSVLRIHDLVGDIRQATNSSVMATEEGSKVVEQVMSLAQQTTDVFMNVEASVSRAAENVEQISLNNKEQAAGITQVVESIESLNRGARESADGLKQTSESLMALNDAVSHLRSMVGIDNAN